jgi:adenosine deaminase
MANDPPAVLRADDDHVRALPKVELHVHVEGAAPPHTIAELAQANGVDLGVDDPADLYRYDDLAAFLRVYDIVCRSLQRADDVHRVTYEALAIAATAGVWYREMFFSPTFLLRHGVPFDTIWTGIRAGIRDAAADHGIVCRMILDVDKPSGPSAASELVALAATCDRDLLIGIGGDAGERGIDLAAFAEPFREARQLGFRTTMHLGEEGATIGHPHRNRRRGGGARRPWIQRARGP